MLDVFSVSQTALNTLNSVLQFILMTVLMFITPIFTDEEIAAQIDHTPKTRRGETQTLPIYSKYFGTFS